MWHSLPVGDPDANAVSLTVAASEKLHVSAASGDWRAETDRHRPWSEPGQSLCVDSRELSPGHLGAIQDLDGTSAGD